MFVEEPAAQVIQRSDDILGGTAVFRGTRVPVRTLLDYLGNGQRLDEFLSDFPTVSREQAMRRVGVGAQGSDRRRGSSWMSACPEG